LDHGNGHFLAKNIQRIYDPRSSLYIFGYSCQANNGGKIHGLVQISQMPHIMAIRSDDELLLARISHNTRKKDNRVCSRADIPVCPICCFFMGRQECLPYCGEKCGLETFSGGKKLP
jgi:hypothetical protein